MVRGVSTAVCATATGETNASMSKASRGPDRHTAQPLCDPGSILLNSTIEILAAAALNKLHFYRENFRDPQQRLRSPKLPHCDIDQDETRRF